MPKLFIGLLLVFCLFQLLGGLFSSDRGQAGIPIAFFIISALVAYEFFAFGDGIRKVLIKLGLGKPEYRGVAVSCLVSVLLLSSFPMFSFFTSAELIFQTDWLWSIPGLFAQAGIAEETLFRGYLFGHLRRGRSFWKAALIATVPFAIVHLILFINMPFAVAAAALGLSIATSFPLSYLYELGGKTIWAPAVLHFVVQGAIKIVSSDTHSILLAVAWMIVCAVLPFAVFFVRNKPEADPL